MTLDIWNNYEGFTPYHACKACTDVLREQTCWCTSAAGDIHASITRILKANTNLSYIKLNDLLGHHCLVVQYFYKIVTIIFFFRKQLRYFLVDRIVIDLR